MPPWPSLCLIADMSVAPAASFTVSMLMPWKWAYVLITAVVLGATVSDTSTVPAFFAAALAIIIASAVAVVPSYIEALDMSMPVRRAIIVWYSKM